jgi:type II secretory pathway component PulM
VTGGTPDLALTGLALAILILALAVIWFVFMRPMDQGLHNRRMEMLRRRLQQNEERLRRDAEKNAEAEGERSRPDNCPPGSRSHG